MHIPRDKVGEDRHRLLPGFHAPLAVHDPERLTGIVAEGPCNSKPLIRRDAVVYIDTQKRSHRGT